MNDTFIYLLKSMIYAGIFFGYYSLFLKNTIYHSYNRYYLLASMALSVVFPMVHLTLGVYEEEVAATPALKYLMYSSSAPVQEAHIPWEMMAMGVISVLLLSYLAYSVLRIFRLKAIHSKTQMGDFTFIETDLEEAPFSFFSNLFWKKSISIEEENGQKMLQHELVHIRQKHTWDRLFSQFICAIFWMNPFNWIIQKELQNIHEFIADRDAVGTGEVDAFAKMLLQTYYGNHFLNPSHSFYYSSIKRRIIMLTTSKTPTYAYLRKVAVLPLFAISLIVISFQLSAQKPKSKKEEAAQFTVTMRPDSTTFSDPKTGKKVFTVATRDMPPPPPPAGAPAPPTPPVLTLHGSGSEVKWITIDSTTVEFKGRNSEGKQVVFRAEKVGNTATSPKEKPLIVIDGVITSDLDMNKINPNNIASMNVLKGEKATTKYAERGANGVIEITTKKP
ncbi:M56 family metallopeptidase [Aquirufa sp. 2-AUSEE-184A6]|uniref:M56 family metallopeptidase n=1 Tax=Aquirufa novilacunae TaxID=3139305 RepID=A0ABW8T0U2_9BACT